MSSIDEVKQKVDIVELVAQYVPGLKKSGKSYKALCPFHPEKTPSFYVFPERQSWHCFGSCGEGGDIFSFIMKREKLDFGEALHLLAQRAGVELAPRPQEGPQDQARGRLIEMHSAAALYYHNLLLHSPEAEAARKHLEKRGISEKSQADFLLGYSLNAWQALHDYLKQRGFSVSELLAAGLAVEREGGGCYDRFRNRLMFPIRDPKGQVIGFGARALDDSLPKYLNSPQTSLFDKGSVLYGIDRSRTAIRREDKAVIVEGYMDVIGTHQHGFENVVASLGTALTERQVGLLKRLSTNLILALDADAAGTEATMRGLEVATASLEKKVVPIPTWQGWISYENVLDAELKVAILPAGKDPDEVVAENPDGWRELIEKAIPIVDYALETVTSRLDLSQPRNKSLAAQRLVPIVAQIKDPVRQSHYLQKLARLLRVDERSLAWMLRRARNAPARGGGRATEQPASPLSPAAWGVEEHCLVLLFGYPELREIAGQVSVDYFLHTENRELFTAWQQAASQDQMTANLNASLREHLESLKRQQLPPSTPSERLKEMQVCILRLRERWLRELKAAEEMAALELPSQDAQAQLAWIGQQNVETATQMGDVFRKQYEQEGTILS